jgi:von Willebrand factor type A domain
VNDIYFLVDRSGSMAGEKWTKTAEALIAFADAAAQNDRVWITFFESNYRDFAENPLERDALQRDPNSQSIAALGHQCSNELPRAWALRANFASGNTFLRVCG